MGDYLIILIGFCLVVKFHKLLIICFLIIYWDLLCYKDTSVFATKNPNQRLGFFLLQDLYTKNLQTCF